ncbi:MAG TPA: asparagine synthase-related protein [Thermoanaerobaculia bacterium]|nr:asparagine synthase-related protein [Thermoanaerobaculia bacterium]
MRGGSAASSLLDGYREHGEAFLREVDGEFAFALWDRHERTLYLCRDSFGTKPLFFACDGRRLVAASEIRQVLRSGVVVASPNRSKLEADFGMGHSAPEETPFAGVYRVLPSQLLRFSPALEWEGSVTWTPPTTVDRRRTEGDVIEELPRVLSRSIARRRWRKPLLTLSSGLDSAAVAAVVSSGDALRKQFSAAGRPRAITLSYAGWDNDETAEAARMAERLSIEHVVVDATTTGPVESAGELAEAFDQPYGGTGYEVPLLLREARRNGHETAAMGLGAEYSWETMPRLAADLFRVGSWGRLYREARDYAGQGSGRISGIFLHDVVRAWAGEGLRRLRHPGSRDAWESMMWRSKAGQMNGVQGGPPMEFLEQIGVHEGVEMVHPFLDREMVEFAFSTPPELLGTLTDRKRLFGRAMDRLLPDPSWQRPKFPGPDGFVKSSLRGVAGWLGPMDRWQLPALLPLDAGTLETLRTLCAGETVESAVDAWTLVCREFWLRRHFPGEAGGNEARSMAVA